MEKNRHKKRHKASLSRVERFITKKIIAIEVELFEESLVMILLRPNFRLPCPNFPSIQLRILSSSIACFLVSILRFFGGLPRGVPLILIPFSLQYVLFLSTGQKLQRVTVNESLFSGLMKYKAQTTSPRYSRLKIAKSCNIWLDRLNLPIAIASKY